MGLPYAPIRHVWGQPMDFGGQRPYLVDCTVHQITTQYTTTTVTQYVTPLTYQYDFTKPLLIAPSPTSVSASESAVCTSTTGTPSATTTQDIRCAPTNLITTVNGYGIAEVSGWHYALAFASDASACCQLCMDTADCAASETDVSAGNCFLWSSNTTCGVGLTYTDANADLAPGSSFVVQAGCGTIQAY